MNARAADNRPAVDLAATGSRFHGVMQGEVRAFLGVAYAAAPVGARRWRPPVAAPPPAGDIDAGTFGADCVQVKRNPGFLGTRAAQRSEDCLYLNVWTPNGARDLPVMVWIHGGGFVGGSGSNITYDGARLAGRGVVVVTLNYRVGIFGYLAHPELGQDSPTATSGNYGLLDQIAALTWVREHIAAFGGDASNITVFGESAGATSISYLLTSPLAKGLIDKVILQSPGPMRGLMPLGEAEQRGADLGAIDWLRDQPANALLALNDQLVPTFRKVVGPRVLGPVLDGWALPHQDWEAYGLSRVAPIPMLVGCNGDEGESAGRRRPFATVETYLAYVRDCFGDHADEALDHYGAAAASGLYRAVADLFGDTQFVFGSRTLARAMAKQEPRTFLYWFDARRAGQRAAPAHGDELPYVFGALDEPFDGETPRSNAADHALSEAMMGAWTTFAATGRPCLTQTPWAPTSAQVDHCMMLNHAPTMGVFPRVRSLDFLARFRALEATA